MHGRRRADIPVLSAEKLEGQRKKVRLGFELLQHLLIKRASCVHTPEVLLATRKLIEFNPELSVIWNYRREVLTRLLQHRQPGRRSSGSRRNRGQPASSSENDDKFSAVAASVGSREESEDDQGSSDDCNKSSNHNCSFCQKDEELLRLLKEELQLTASGLLKGSGKAYCLWLHRSWTLARLAAHEYERHEFHLSSADFQGRQGAFLERNKNSNELKRVEHKEQQRQHADCRCCRAPCFVGGPNSKGSPAIQCGIDRALMILHEEINECEKIIKEVDGRNFHCWQHRSMVLVWQAAFLRYKKTWASYSAGKARTSLFLSSDCAQLSASLSRCLIDFDFSNYSAWHLRSLLPDVQHHTTEEFSWLWQGIYTEPTDQSLWQYYTWLLTGSEAVRTGRLLAVRDSVSSNGIPLLFFFFSEPCALEPLKCRVEILQEEGMKMTKVEGEWTLLSHLHTERTSGFNSALMRRDCRRLSRVWTFAAKETRGRLCGKVRVHLAMTLYSGSVRDDGNGIDSFHLQRLKCHAPELAPLTDFCAEGSVAAAERHNIEEPACTDVHGTSFLTHSKSTTDGTLWQCVSLARPNEPAEAPGTTAGAFLPWTISHEAGCRAVSCGCTTVEGDFEAAGAVAEAACFAEAVAAAGGTLSVGLPVATAQREIDNIEELLRLEPDCKGALEAKLRLLRFLRPHSFEEYKACCSALMVVDSSHERMHRDEATSATVRTMLDWHVPYLPFLRVLDISGTKISKLSLLLLSLAQLPRIERVDASFTLLSLLDDTGLAEDEELKLALQTSILTEIAVTATPLAVTLTPGSVVYKFFRLERRSDGDAAQTPCFLRRLVV